MGFLILLKPYTVTAGKKTSIGECLLILPYKNISPAGVQNYFQNFSNKNASIVWIIEAQTLLYLLQSTAIFLNKKPPF